MRLAYQVIDVFTRNPLEGNGLAVFTAADSLDEARLQPLARELNLSETVFALAPRDGGDARIRIFTPGAELPFAGHPVLGSAIVLGAALGREAVTLETGIGPVQVTLRREGQRVAFGRMSQPVPTWRGYEREDALLDALDVERAELPVEVYANGPEHVFVTLADENRVAALRPDMRALAELGPIGVSCCAGAGTRWKTRMFAPGLGVAEDPATGSAAGPLAVHLSRHGRIAFGAEIEIRQGAELQRPSLLYARADGTAEHVDRVEVAGAGVIVARGEFELD